MGEVYSARVRTRTKLIERKMVNLKSRDESDHSASWIEDRYRQVVTNTTNVLWALDWYQERVDSINSDILRPRQKVRISILLYVIDSSWTFFVCAWPPRTLFLPSAVCTKCVCSWFRGASRREATQSSEEGYLEFQFQDVFVWLSDIQGKQLRDKIQLMRVVWVFRWLKSLRSKAFEQYRGKIAISMTT